MCERCDIRVVMLADHGAVAIEMVPLVQPIRPGLRFRHRDRDWQIDHTRPRSRVLVAVPAPPARRARC